MKISNILLQEFAEYRSKAKKLESELRDTYNRDDIYVNMGVYSAGRSNDDPLKDKGYGKVTFQTKEELSSSEWKSIKNFLQVKGYEITSDSNFYDTDDDRFYYPSLKFQFSA